MADLSGITDLNFTGLMRGAYKDPVFGLEGVDELATLVEILEWLGNNVGGGGGGSAGPYDVYDDDAAAASGGVPIGGIYVRSAASGFSGLLAQRLI